MRSFVSPALLTEPVYDEEAVPAALQEGGADLNAVGVACQLVVGPRSVHRGRGCEDAARVGALFEFPGNGAEIVCRDPVEPEVRVVLADVIVALADKTAVRGCGPKFGDEDG